MEFSLETPLPSRLEVGQGTALLLRGWCYDQDQPLRKAEILVEGRAFPIARHSLTRFDVLREREPDLLGKGNALNSGFSVVIPISAVSEGKTISLSIRAEFPGGVSETAEIGTIHLMPGVFAGPVDSGGSPSPSSGLGVKESLGRIAIVLVVRDADAPAIRAQIDTFRAQTYTNWHCLLSVEQDETLGGLLQELSADKRFTLRRFDAGDDPRQIFQSALAEIPSGTDFVAVTDPGDTWHVEKLKECIAAFEPNTGMVFTDWESSEEDRHASDNKPGSTRLETALFGRLIPSASMIFRRSLLTGMLPLPPETPRATPEEWISIAGLALGDAKFVDKQLYKPAQNPGGVLFEPTSWMTGAKGIARWMDELMLDRSKPDSEISNWAGKVWIAERSAFWSAILAQRNPTWGKKQTIEKWAQSLNSSSGMRGEAKEEGAPGWSTYFALRAENLLSTFTNRHRAAVLRSLRTIWGLGGKEKAGMVNAGIDAARMHIDFIPKKIAPLNLDVSPNHPRRVNIVTSTIDFKYLFGGYFAVFSLALALDKAGYKVRLILTDPVEYKPTFWKHEIKKYHGLGDFFDRVEVLPNYERGPVESSPDDRFIATSWWTAFAAHSGAQKLGTDRFIYLSQDFEPFFYAASSFYALSLQSYSLPHYAIFSTEFLREYSRAHGHGVFAEGREAGDKNSTSFENAIKAPTPRREKLVRHGSKRRVLVYARPEDHANRNCFQLAALGLIGAIDEGHFKPEEWEFHGIGSVKVNGNMRLSGRAHLKLLPKVSLEEYYSLLQDYDIGLSLMLTPHPSLVPLDMAASGIVTVTNTFDIKTAERLQPISSNLVVVPPTIEGIRDGLIAAKSKVDDIDARMKGTKLNWARTWEQAFDAAFVQKLVGWIEAGR